MKHYLGIDIGTFESKGVLVDDEGTIVATAAKPHRMLVPQPGWAEHRPARTGGTTSPSEPQAARRQQGAPERHQRGRGQRHRPLHAAGRRRRRATDERRALWRRHARGAGIDELTAAIGEDVLLDRCGNALTSQSVGPKSCG